MTLTSWELRRILRSRAAAIAMLVIPIACAAIPHDRALNYYFPLAAAVVAAGLLCSRFFSDRASGFADALSSTPAAGSALRARFVTGSILVLIQSVVFYAILRLIG